MSTIISSIILKMLSFRLFGHANNPYEMSKHISPFKFKQFSVSHHRSSMKVGVDGVLIGSWTDVEDVKTILDVGSGCGLIALMMAQRCPDAKVIGIEIDPYSVDEASENVNNSEWADRIKIILGSFPDELNHAESRKYDLIVSNPPYFDSGVTDIATRRERARHQGGLSPSVILQESKQLLTPSGRLAMVVPAEISSALEKEAETLGFSLMKKCLVRGHENAPYKRSLLQWSYVGDFSEKDDDIIEYLTLEASPNIPTEEYRMLCKDFYLKF